MIYIVSNYQELQCTYTISHNNKEGNNHTKIPTSNPMDKSDMFFYILKVRLYSDGTASKMSFFYNVITIL